LTRRRSPSVTRTTDREPKAGKESGHSGVYPHVFDALPVPKIGILPRGLVRIRHFGILGSSAKAVTIPLIHHQLGILLPEKEPRVLEIYNPRYCACCDNETMISIHRIPNRGPPKSSYLPKILTI
jgi:hypothetical protein